jgi:hypothetical protein
MLSLMSSAVSHEMITPLKCLISMSQGLGKKITSESLKYEVELISITSKMLLNQVKGHLDRNLLDANLFQP